MRIEQHPILSFDRGEKVTFLFNGQPVEGYTTETIAAALHAAGVRVLSHSPELDRPRGLFCAIGNCSSCRMKPVCDEIDGLRELHFQKEGKTRDLI